MEDFNVGVKKVGPEVFVRKMNENVMPNLVKMEEPVLTALAITFVAACRASKEKIVKLTLMNAPVDHVSMAVHALMASTDTPVIVCPNTWDKIAAIIMIHAWLSRV